VLQKTELIGNLGGDPELRYLPNGTGVCNFSLATNRAYTKNGEKVKETCWFRVSVWGAQGEACNNYLKRGSKVYIEGRLNPDENGGPRTWTNKEGNAQASYEVTAERVTFLDSKGEGHKAAEEFAGEAGGYMEESELPF